MKQMKRIALVGAALFGLLPSGLDAQSFDVTGTRAAGMGGAFVGVADDATALYWNPAGLAAGSYFSLVLDAAGQRAVPDTGLQGSRQSSFFLGLTTPALGVAYYRLQQDAAGPYSLLVPTGDSVPNRNLQGAAEVRRGSLTTHHAGLTLVQSIVPNVAVGATLKMVRGFASSEIVLSTARDALDEDAQAASGSSRFDADLGIMASSRRLKGGLTLRNLREPEFTTREGVVLRLERQLRGGVSWAVTPNWLLASDIDLLVTHDAFGERRDAAVGIEGKLARRSTIRSGLKLNLADARDVAVDGSARGYSVGGTFAVTPSVLVDTVAVTGGDRAGRGWGISARFVY
ncbi:MAG: conjugal transfer protein TraF [Vicinamibacterales bacterium]